jgi:alcohol dehydrogenase class IV
MQAFRIPGNIVYGEGAISYLAQLEGKKAMLVTGGSSMKRSGFLDKAADLLKEAGMEVTLFDGVEPDPSVKTVFLGAKAMQEFCPDWIVAIGGGSAIDAAKAMWIFYEYPELSFSQIIEPFSIPQLRKKAKFAAIPSTSGTATEVTAFTVITDTDTHNSLKYPLVSYEIIPDVAIVDPDLTVTMPSRVTAYTGMDALTHAIEAYVSTANSIYTDPLALEAIRTICAYLPKAYDNGEDKEARAKMHYAQCLAGMAFTNALLGIVHSMAHKIGAQFHIPHGEANATLLPYVIQYNAKNALERYADIAQVIGINTSDPGEAVQKLVEFIKDLNHRVGMPVSLNETDIAEDEFFASLDETSQNALGDPCTGTNPRIPSVEDIKQIYTAAFLNKNVEV